MRDDISALTGLGRHNHLGPQEIVVGDFECDGLNKLFSHKPSRFCSAVQKKPKKEYAVMAVVTMRELLDSGVHFGHQTRRWNPKMKRFIFTERNGIYIIDIQQSLALIDSAYEFVKDTVAKGGHVLFVGTKKQAHEPIINHAARVGMPTVTERWLGGMLTNFPTVYKRIQRLKELEALEEKNDLLLTKKELLVLRREREKLFKNLDGIRNMTKLPSAIWVVDTKKEHLAVQEAKKLGIPVIAILDTNCDPDEVDYKIPGNDDAIRSIDLLTRVITDAIAAGLKARSANVKEETKSDAPAAVAAGEPLADWEKEILDGSAPTTPEA
jgi:small subunit ribosomal protein S2